MIINTQEKYKILEKKLIKLDEISQNNLIFEPLWKDFCYRLCWSSNSIEGNTLSLEETIETLEFDKVHSNHTYKEYTDARSLYRAIEESLSVKPIEINDTWIKQCNNTIIQRGAKYRESNLYIGSLTEAVYYPPDFKEVEKRMEEWFEKINKKYDSLVDIIKNIAIKHIEFERIHPFPNGNGRTGRIILNQQLINHNIFPIAITDKSKYRQAFRYYDKNKDTSLMEYLIIYGEIKALDKYNDLLEKYNKAFNIDETIRIKGKSR